MELKRIIDFSIICLCFLTALSSYRFCFNKRNWLFLFTGMCFTVISDFFLVLLQNQQIGFVTFCFVHIAYNLRVTLNIKRSLVFILGTLILCVPLTFIIGSLSASMAAYAFLFIQNIIVNIHSFKKNTTIPKINRILILLGIILFFLCDINVLIDIFRDNVPERVWEIAHFMIWIFYAPAQVLLSISAFKYGRKKHES